MVHVRTEAAAAARAFEPKELVDAQKVRASTLVSRLSTGPFRPLALALERDAPLRDSFARAIRTPSLEAWSRARWIVLAMAAPPLALLLELDRELVTKGLLGGGRFVVDLLVAGYVAFELTRLTPRMPAIAGAALLAAAMRWSLVASRSCGKGVHVVVWVAAALSIVAGLAILVRAPSRARVALELMGKLGIDRADVIATKKTSSPQATTSLVTGAVVAAVGLPLALWALRKAGVGVELQAAAIVAYAVVVPAFVMRPAIRERRGESTGSGDILTPVDALFAMAMGLVLTSALLHGTHQFFDIGGEVARCVGRLDEESRRLLAAEAAEVSKRLSGVRASTTLALATTVAMPFAEERIFRGLLMDVLVRKYGLAYGLFASAAAFGVAHVGVYEIALYQTVLLGIGFGLAYAEGGLLAAFVAHAAWNLIHVA